MPGQSASLLVVVFPCLCVRWVIEFLFGSNLAMTADVVCLGRRSTEFLEECRVVRGACWRVTHSLPDVGLRVQGMAKTFFNDQNRDEHASSAWGTSGESIWRQLCDM